MTRNCRTWHDFSVYESGGPPRYLYVASQGDSTIAIFRTANNSIVQRIRLVSGPSADGCDDNSSLAVVAAGLGPRFPRGLLICHDKLNTAPGTTGAENYKYIRLEKALESPTGGPFTARG